MTKLSKPECKLVIAGPGAGKTHSMVQKVLECMETLHPTKFCVVITYTNAATEEIKSRLGQYIKIPSNVFIGTIHSFLNRFIFAPYAQIRGITSEDYFLIDSAKVSIHVNSGKVGQTVFKTIHGMDTAKSKLLFKELTYKKWINDKGYIQQKFNPSLKSLSLNQEYQNIEARIIETIASCIDNAKQRKESEKRLGSWQSNELSKHGFITYDKLLEKSKELIQYKTIVKQVSNRLQHIFVDEYQDIRVWQHEIFMTIFKQGKTNLFCIGDPLQSIFKFSYFSSQNKGEKEPKTFEEAPIFDLKNKYGICSDFVQKNYRSRPVIVDFIEQYTSKIALHQYKNKEANDVPIYFLNFGKNRSKAKSDSKKELDFNTIKDIISEFNSVIETHQIQKELNKEFRLVLVDERSTIEYKQTELGAIELAKGKHKETSYINEISRCILSVVGYKLSEVIDRNNLEDVLKYRKFCLSTLRGIKICEKDKRVEFIKKKFQFIFQKNIGQNSKNIDFQKLLENITSTTHQNHKEEENILFSTIHSAKGLEATNVLVIAKTKNELKSWLDFEKCFTSTNDNHRLGYVAFSRARELLCISCLEEIDAKLADNINSLGIKLLQSNNPTVSFKVKTIEAK